MAAFDEATRDLHEGAVVRKALHLPQVTSAAEETPEDHDNEPSWDAPPAEPPVNRLLTPEERGDAPAESQVDLLSSIGELTLAEKLALQPLGSVAEGMSILDRAQYTSVLFSGEEEVCSTLLEKLSGATREGGMVCSRGLDPTREDKEVEGLKESFAKRIMRTFVS